MRNLLRKAYLAAGKDGEGNQRTRIRVEEFGVAIRFAEKRGSEGGEGEGEDVVMAEAVLSEEERRLRSDEVECFLANMIYKVRLFAPISAYTLPLLVALSAVD